jgi:hypothetical protein
MKNSFENYQEKIQEINCIECGKTVEIHITPDFLGKEVAAVDKNGKYTGRMIRVIKENPAAFICRACQMEKTGQLEKIVQQEEKRNQQIIKEKEKNS